MTMWLKCFMFAHKHFLWWMTLEAWYSHRGEQCIPVGGSKIHSTQIHPIHPTKIPRRCFSRRKQRIKNGVFDQTTNIHLHLAWSCNCSLKLKEQNKNFILNGRFCIQQKNNMKTLKKYIFCQLCVWKNELPLHVENRL